MENVVVHISCEGFALTTLTGRVIWQKGSSYYRGPNHAPLRKLSPLNAAKAQSTWEAHSKAILARYHRGECVPFKPALDTYRK